ncbi:amino acid ABC transporter permease [Agromyces silvae]|uniref:amino acid ABC transporter permease n=1 Tax=Agromyces silvae TaxID=3388266 RepID=UPI00280AE55E|nr:amino acid ABC transporter permease [Agromyces protaetiae]
MDVVLDHLGQILAGLGVTLVLAVTSFAGALVFGAVLGVLRLLPFGVLQATSTAVITVVRNMPLLLVVVIAVFALPQLGVTLPLDVCVAVSLMVYFACYIAEILRSGVQTVGQGQVEAARALGLSDARAAVTIVAPQAALAMVQPLGTMFIATLLSTAIGSIVGVLELSGVTRLLNVQYAEPIAIFGTTAAIYIVLSLTIGGATGWLERKVRVTR